MKVLYIGDIMGEPGRRAVARAVPRLVSQRQIDVVVGNGENVAGGFGITPDLADELFGIGLSAITTGNHAWDKKEILDYFPRERRLLRPANYPEGVPGQGSVVIRTKSGEEVAVLQLMGRAYMPTLDCPFQVAKREMSRLRKLVAANGRRADSSQRHRVSHRHRHDWASAWRDWCEERACHRKISDGHAPALRGCGRPHGILRCVDRVGRSHRQGAVNRTDPVH